MKINLIRHYIKINGKKAKDKYKMRSTKIINLIFLGIEVKNNIKKSEFRFKNNLDNFLEELIKSEIYLLKMVVSFKNLGNDEN